MPTLNIVLVEPQIPQNTGNVARTCAVTGARLHLVGPMGFTIDDKKLKRAGLDYWPQLDITYYQDLSAFWAANRGPFFFFTSKGPHRHTDAVYPDGAYLVFGREDAGLPGRSRRGAGALRSSGLRPRRRWRWRPLAAACAAKWTGSRPLPRPRWSRRGTWSASFW